MHSSLFIKPLKKKVIIVSDFCKQFQVPGNKKEKVELYNEDIEKSHSTKSEITSMKMDETGGEDIPDFSNLEASDRDKKSSPNYGQQTD